MKRIWSWLHAPIPAKRSARRNTATTPERLRMKSETTLIRKILKSRVINMKSRYACTRQRLITWTTGLWLAAMGHQPFAIVAPECVRTNPQHYSPDYLQRDEILWIARTGVKSQWCRRQRGKGQPLEIVP